MTLNLKEILNCVSGKLILEGMQYKFNNISIDTRNMKDQEIFLAIRGKNFNGNKYVPDAVKNGAKLCILDEEYFSIDDLKQFDVSIILVENTLVALERLAVYVRSKLNVDIIAVTGSVGKTTTKDIIYSFLASKYRVYKAKGNFNNHLGMPISLINIDDDAEIGVFELGMSNLGEIDYLVKILRPNIGVITNIAENHIEFLHTRENILKAKLEIINYFNDKSILILNNEDDMLKNLALNFKTFRIGFSEECDLYAENIRLTSYTTGFDLVYHGMKEKIVLPILGKHNVLNALFAFKLCDIFNISIDLIKDRCNNLDISSMRQEIFKYKNMMLINDCYNAGPSSMKSSIDVLELYKDKERLCILGDMAELGDKACYYHNEISKYLNGKVNRVVAIGKYRNEYKKYFNDSKNCFCFESTEDFEKEIHSIINGSEVVLIKASRASKFEKIKDMIRKNF